MILTMSMARQGRRLDMFERLCPTRAARWVAPGALVDADLELWGFVCL
jgi:hypothetical protein